MSETGHHGHSGHTLAGHGDGIGLAQANSPHHPGHGFLSHLLGLDHNHAGHLHNHPAMANQPNQTAQSSPSMSDSVQSMKLSDLLHGINITPNTLFLLLFAGFIAWLGVVYWIRHHEPLANQVLGNRGGYSPTAAYDRQLVEKMRQAIPVRTSANTGSVYTPTSNVQTQINAMQTGAILPSTPVQVTTDQAVAPTPAATTYAPSAFTSNQIPTIQTIGNTSQMGAYMVPIQTPVGVKVKMITNR